MKKRKLEIIVLSDIHLSTFGSKAKEVSQYLDSIDPEMLILNGDIVDVWQFSKNYFPKSHFKVLQQIIQFAAKGIPVYYLTGNHDDMLRHLSDVQVGNVHLRDKLLLDVDGKKVWIFHGDVFDASIKKTKWIAKMGSNGYGFLILVNQLINWILGLFGQPKMSLSKKIKDSVKKAVSIASDFEKTATDLAIDKGYDYVICGHIHKPQMKQITNEKGSVWYLNSGDWMENLTALEYNKGQWSMYKYHETHYGLMLKPKKKKAKQRHQELREAVLN